MTRQLRISDDLTLPLEAVTEPMGMLAARRAGKSNAAVVLAEEMFDAGLHWVAIDPKGDWWGIRSDAEGKPGGLQVPILGGAHGDIPLEPGAGAYIADLIVDEHLTCLLDVSGFASEAEKISPASGTFRGYLSRLRVNRLLDESGGLVRAGEALFIGGGR